MGAGATAIVHRRLSPGVTRRVTKKLYTLERRLRLRAGERRTGPLNVAPKSV